MIQEVVRHDARSAYTFPCSPAVTQVGILRPISEIIRIITTVKKSQCRIAAQMIVRMVFADLGGLVGEMMFFVARGSGRCSQDVFGGHLSWLQRRKRQGGSGSSSSHYKLSTLHSVACSVG